MMNTLYGIIIGPLRSRSTIFFAPISSVLMAISLFQQSFLSAAGYASAFAAFMYDYGLTFAREVRFVWGAKRKFSFALVLFYVVRYTTLLAAVLVVVTTWSPKSYLKTACKLSDVYDTHYFVMCMYCSRREVFSAMRVYALYYGNHLVFGFVLLLGLVNPIISTLAVLSPTLNTCGMVARLGPAALKKCGCSVPVVFKSD
ncbi:hypothetical protein BKA93DRAFT_306851 [Sparassis latifolia]